VGYNPGCYYPIIGNTDGLLAGFKGNNKMSLITIDPKEIKILAKEGEKFIFKPKAEEQLLKLLKLQDDINNAVEEVKVKIAEAGKAINPNFKGVLGESVKCVYRKYGSKYSYDKNLWERLLPFLTEKKYYSVEADKVDVYVKEAGELPQGIIETEREGKLSIMRMEEE